MRDARLVLWNEEGMLLRILDAGGGDRPASQAQMGWWVMSLWPCETSV